MNKVIKNKNNELTYQYILIALMRNELNNTINEYGVESEKTLKVSKRLDELITEKAYQDFIDYLSINSKSLGGI